MKAWPTTDPAGEKSSPQPPPASDRSRRVLGNALWEWMGLGANMITGLVLAPFLIRKLGAEAYGIWSLVFSAMGYYSLADFGFRAAAVRFVAHYDAQRRQDQINELINSLLVYFSAVSGGLLLLSAVLARYATRLFQVSAAQADDFGPFVFLVGVTLAITVSTGLFSGSLEGFQRFDVSNTIRALIAIARCSGLAVLLALGYGLVAMAAWTVAVFVAGYVAYFQALRRVFPQLRLSLRLAKRTTLRETLGFSSYTFLTTLAYQSIEQCPPLVLAYFHPLAFVGYYSLPLRLVEHTADTLSRISVVATPEAARLAASGRLEVLPRLAIYANRYCLTLYMPAVLALLVYGPEIMEALAKEEFAAHAAPLIPVLLFGVATTTGAQYASATILVGLARQQRYAQGVAAEAACNLIGLLLLVPRYGPLGAAAVTASLMFLVRGVFTPWLICRVLGFPLGTYLRSIFVRPMMTAAPVLVLLWLWKTAVWPAPGLAHLIAVCGATTALYLGAATVTCLEPEHRGLLWRWVFRRFST